MNQPATDMLSVKSAIHVMVKNFIDRLQHKPGLIVLVLFGFSLFVRFYNFENRLYWYGDTARDYLVSGHIAKYGETLSVGPAASGVSDYFYYPPLYYFMLSFVVRMNDSLLFFFGFFAALQSFSVFIAYYIAKENGGKKAGIIAAFVFATSENVISLGSTVHGAVVVTPLFLLGFVLYLKSIHKRDFIMSVLAFALFILSSAVSYVVLAMFPMLLIYYLIKATFPTAQKIFLCLIILVYSGVLFFPIINFFGPGVFFAKFSPSGNITASVDVYGRLLTIGKTYLEVFTSYHPSHEMFTLAIFIAAIILLFFLREIIKKIDIFLYMVIWTIVLGAFRNGEFYPHWAEIPILLLYLSISILLASALQHKIIVLRVFSAVVTCVFLFIQISYFSYIHRINDAPENSLSISRELFAFVSSRPYFNPPYTPVYLLSKENLDWDSTRIWYFIESRYGKVLRLVNRGNNLEYITMDPKIVFIFCEPESPIDEEPCSKLVQTQYKQFTVHKRETYKTYILYTLTKKQSD